MRSEDILSFKDTFKHVVFGIIFNFSQNNMITSQNLPMLDFNMMGHSSRDYDNLDL